MLNNSCKSAGTLALLVLFASTTFAFDFNSYNYFNSFNYRNKGYESKHYVAIVPADLRSAGIEY